MITLHPSVGYANSTFTFGVQMEITGSISGNADGGGILQASSTIDSATLYGAVLCTAAPSVCSPLSQTPAGNVDQILIATINVDTSNPIVFIQDTLFAAVNCINSNCLSSQSGRTDFSHTAQLSLILPDGFTFTSDSGVFLSNVDTGPGPTTAPEPATLALLGLGLAGLVATRRRKQLSSAALRQPDFGGVLVYGRHGN